jgi:hypothetical protein
MKADSEGYLAKINNSGLIEEALLIGEYDTP